MPGRKKELINLIKKYRLGKASPQEVDFLEKYYQYFDKEEKISQTYSETEKTNLGKKIFSAIQSRKNLAPVIPVHRRRWFRVAAASVLLFFAGSVYFILRHSNENLITKTEPQEIRFKNDVAAPASTKATITLADGKVVPIDSLTTLSQNGVDLTKTVDGKIIYSAGSSPLGEAGVKYNTLSNPRGSKVIDMQLSDGSHVWLNAGSSVTYPVAFIGNERKVTITGEAYFEVKHLIQGNIPFSVEANGVITEVLGTHFNVNGYSDEANVKVTLLEGSVKVSKGNAIGLLKPGQQAQVSNDVKIISSVDIEEVMAWKDGVFKFKEATIEMLMRQIEKWYDVDINYEGKVSSHFVVTIPRTVNMSNVFKILEETGGVHFKIDGRKVTVMP
ncbi:MAG: FecR domain-containing protein [Ferruginibacter sp.]|nr:FecR domain-containing protein [Bacteroidota bacterium]MBX2920167.1 FecR domain-containing protein [Ferruginibacter sp.]